MCSRCLRAAETAPFAVRRSLRYARSLNKVNGQLLPCSRARADQSHKRQGHAEAGRLKLAFPKCHFQWPLFGKAFPKHVSRTFPCGGAATYSVSSRVGKAGCELSRTQWGHHGSDCAYLAGRHSPGGQAKCQHELMGLVISVPFCSAPRAIPSQVLAGTFGPCGRTASVAIPPIATCEPTRLK